MNRRLNSTRNCCFIRTDLILEVLNLFKLAGLVILVNGKQATVFGAVSLEYWWFLQERELGMISACSTPHPTTCTEAVVETGRQLRIVISEGATKNSIANRCSST